MRFFIPLRDTVQPPIDERALQGLFPDVGNPAGLPAADLAARGYTEITLNDPLYDPATQYPAQPVNKQVAGVWQRTTSVLNYTQGELDARAAAKFSQAQSAALIEIDAGAEAQRAKYITPGFGQAMSYNEKNKQAIECLATASATAPPASGVYVLLDSEVGITKNANGTLTANAYEVAVAIDAARQSWLTGEAAINVVRIKAKADIKAATTPTEIPTIMAAIVWPQ